MHQHEPRLNGLDAALLNLVRYGLFFVFLLPFVVVLDHLYPWVSGKIWGFEILVEILFPFWVLLIFRRREFRPAATGFLYALLAYFAIATLAMLLGENAHRSFWSKPDRLTGMFFQYHLLAFFLMAGSAWRGMLSRAIGAAVLTASVLSLHALQQVVSGSAADGRGSATLGNASYLGQYLVPHFFLSGWLIRRHWRSNGLRLLWLGLSAVILIGIFATKSKGALVGLFLGALAAVLVGAFKGSARTKKASRWGLAALALVIAAYIAGNYVRPFKVWLYESRLSIQYLRETSGSRRLLLQNAVKGIRQRPLLGWGPENFEDGFYFNYDPVTLRYSEYETRQDRPHNLILEILHNLGVIGLLAYAAVFGFGARLVMRMKDEESLGAALVLTAAISQVATDLFIFETPMSYMALFTMLALLQASASSGGEEGPDEAASGAVPAALIAAAASLWALFGVQSGTITGAKITARVLVGLQQGMKPEEAKTLVDELRALKTPMLERYLRAITSNMSRGREDYVPAAWIPLLSDVADDMYARLQGNRTDFVHGLVTTAAYLSIDARTPDQQAALEDALKATEARSPNRHEVLLMRMQALTEKGRLDEAEEVAKRLVALDEENAIGLAYYARFLLAYRDPVRAAEVVAPKFEEIHGNDAMWDQIELGTLSLLNRKRFEDLGRLHEASVRLGIRNLQWDAMGVIAAFAGGDDAKAMAMAEEAKKTYPDSASLIDQLVAGRETVIGPR